MEDNYRVRMRIDGVLHICASPPVNWAARLTARRKIMGQLDIAERRLPQDGQFSFVINAQSISLRIATLPVLEGEKVVLCVLQTYQQMLTLDSLGLSLTAYAYLAQALQQPQGMILVTGPTGSGKTVTLYSAICWLNESQRTIFSVEDPVEIPLPGINQTAVNLKAELDFSRILRALLRQDPDVVMIGEIRDSETAEIAVKAAQTGHLVLSTLHTNSAIETLTRLGHLGIPGYLLAGALTLLIAQRLVRRLCPHCKTPASPPLTFPDTLWATPVPHWEVQGCEHCVKGYYARTALYELLPLTPALRDALSRPACKTSWFWPTKRVMTRYSYRRYNGFPKGRHPPPKCIAPLVHHHTLIEPAAMPQKLYSWLALASDGELQRGESIGNARQQVYLRLAQRRYQPLRLRYRQTLTRRYWKATPRIALFKQVAALLQAGLPLLAEQHELPGWRCLINALADGIAEGDSFSDVLRHYPQVFPTLYPTLVAVGEITGKLDVCCQQLAMQQAQQLQLQKKVKHALRYPGFVLGVSITVSIVMLLWVLPEFASLYEAFETPLPPLTQRVLAMAEVMTRHALLLLTLPVSIVLGYPVCRARSMALRRQEERFLLKIPLLGALLRGAALSYLFTLLALTQRAGLTLPAGLTAATALPYFAYQEALRSIRRNIEQGNSLQQSMTPYSRLFPAPCAQLIRVGEETGALDNMFNQLAHWHQQQTARRAETLTHTLEPLLIVLVGGIIGTLLIAMYLPIFHFGNLMANA